MTLTLLHISDVHYGVDAQLDQLEAIEAEAATVRPAAIVLSGDLSQRARHGEFQAAHGLLRRLNTVAPTMVVPGNHDVQWWKSPMHLLGTERLYTKYRRWFGADLTPVLEIPGAVLAGALTAWGVAPGSLTWNLRDLAVKGHLPRSETVRVQAIFAQAPAAAARVLVMHHNVLRGGISERMGLAHYADAQHRIAETGADVVLCGHDHQEGAGQVGNVVAISTAGTHTSRTRGGRPSVFNVVRIKPTSVEIQHYRWESEERRFVPSDKHSFARRRGEAAVSVAGGGGAL